MDFETLRVIAKEYGIEITQTEMDVLLAIAQLPTSDIVELFNKIAIEDVFNPKTERLF